MTAMYSKEIPAWPSLEDEAMRELDRNSTTFLEAGAKGLGMHELGALCCTITRK